VANPSKDPALALDTCPEEHESPCSYRESYKHLMKNNPTAFVLIVSVLRLTGVYLSLSLFYSLATALFGMPSGMAGSLSRIMLRGSILPLVSSLILWFIARPVAKWILSDFDEA
jgi:hypothetical protein